MDRKLLSIITRLFASQWMSSIQIWGSDEHLANLASLSATALPLCFTWEKEAARIFDARARASSVMWTKEAQLDAAAVRCLNTTLESPSNTTSCRPISLANVTDLLQAIASKSSTDGGRGTRSARAEITRPSWFWITTPRPPQFMSWNNAPSQFALNCWGNGGTNVSGVILQVRQRKIGGNLKLLKPFQSVPMDLCYWQRWAAHSHGVAIKPDAPRDECHCFRKVITLEEHNAVE